jgi:hypothetical protein
LTLAALSAPLFARTHCRVEVWGIDVSPATWVIALPPLGVPRIGNHFVCGCVTAVLWAVLLEGGNFDASASHRLWTQRYAIATFALSAVETIGKPWLLAVCPLELAVWFNVMIGVTFAAFAASQGILAYLIVLRLQIAAEASAARAKRLLDFFLSSALLNAAGLMLSVLRIVPKWVSLCLTTVALLAYVVFQSFVLAAFVRNARETTEETRPEAPDAQATATKKQTLATVALLAASASTTIIFVVVGSVYVDTPKPSLALEWAFEISVILHVPLDAGLALLCAGFVGPASKHAAELAEAARQPEARRQKQILDRLVEATRSSTGSVLALAALLEGEDPEMLGAQAVARFRCVRWDVLSRMPEILINAGPLDGQQASVELYQLSKPCRVGECDAFCSHSWHDDGWLKWNALKKWCDGFKRNKERSPRLWLDKVCIDQADLKADLQSLPIFLAACNRLLVVSGPTYVYRLWCCVELFVYVSMLAEDESAKKPVILTIGADSDELENVREQWRSFDATACQCFNEDDKRRIFAVIESHPGGVQGFNDHVKILAASLLERTSRKSTELAVSIQILPEVLSDTPWDSSDLLLFSAIHDGRGSSTLGSNSPPSRCCYPMFSKSSSARSVERIIPSKQSAVTCFSTSSSELLESGVVFFELQNSTAMLDTE